MEKKATNHSKLRDGRPRCDISISYGKGLRPYHLYGLQPGRAMKPVVLVEDNGPIHTSKLTLKALETRRHWLTVEWLPKYAILAPSLDCCA
jgi:transposase